MNSLGSDGNESVIGSFISPLNISLVKRECTQVTDLFLASGDCIGFH